MERVTNYDTDNVLCDVRLSTSNFSVTLEPLAWG